LPSLRRYCIVIFAVTAAGAFASGCGRPVAPVPPATLRIGVGAPPELTRSSGVNAVITNVTSDPWVAGLHDGHVAPRIIADWSSDPTNTVLHLTLRSDVYFHDGTPLTADIAADALRRTRAKADQVGPLALLSVKSIDVIGTYKLDLHLSEPNSFILSDLTTINLRKPGDASIGTGPFMVTKRDAQHAVLSAFSKYYRGRPGLAEIDVVNYPTQRNAWAALMRGDVDMLYEVSRDAADFVSAESTVNTYTFARPYYIALVFNVRHPILKKVDVRRAINEAMDRTTLVHDGLSDQGRPADGPIWPEHWARPAAPPQFTYNPDDARRLLDAAGLKAPRSAGGSMPSRFSFTCLVYAEDSRFERVSVLVQKELADVGVEMKLQPVKANEISDLLKKGEFDAFIFEFFGRSLSSAYDFWHHHEGALLDSGYVAADAVLDRIRTAQSETETKAAVVDLTKVLYDDPPAAFLAWQASARAVSKRFDVSDEPGRDILGSVWRWKAVGPSAQVPQ
jgi:peptide/nickel transport system substrate-binding protein